MMKNIATINCLLACLIISFTSCKRDGEEPTDPSTTRLPDGIATAKNNAEPWEILAFVTKRNIVPPRVQFRFDHYSEEGYLRGGLGFYNLPIATGSYAMKEKTQASFGDTLLTCSYNTMLYDGDISGDFYVPLHGSSMMFTIDRINLTGDSLSGRFWGTMVKKIIDMEYDPASPDTVVFSEGMYQVRLE
jgi:hypothetical protein